MNTNDDIYDTDAMRKLAASVAGAVFVGETGDEPHVLGANGLQVVKIKAQPLFDLWTDSNTYFAAQRSFADAVKFLSGEMG